MVFKFHPDPIQGPKTNVSVKEGSKLSHLAFLSDSRLQWLDDAPIHWGE